ncbi:MAG: oligosaccharide flippase family protein [Acidobacteria bacterium]|nr:oligosaccharide flippase family protein [Acidobacteriota bacterium]
MSPEVRERNGAPGAGETSTLAVRGASWTVFGVGAQRLAQTIALLVLARILVPEDFGLVALATLFLSFAHRTKSLGLQTALLQFRSEVGAAADAAFLINGAITLAVLVLIVVVSPLVSSWFANPRAGAVLVVMSLRLIPQAAAAVPSALAAKALRFRKLALITLVESVVAAVVAVVMAVRGFGVWALVAGSVGGATVAAVLWWCPPEWRPRFRLDREASRRLVHEGVRIWSSGNLAFFIDSANRLFMGWFLGVAVLGLYDVASRLVHAPLQSLLGINDRVALPAFCREQHDRQVLGGWLIRLTEYLLLITAPAAGILFFFADVLVPVLIGSRWSPVVGPVRALAPYVLVMPLLSMSAVYIARGKTELLLRFTVARAVVTVTALFAASHISLLAVCLVESGSAALFVPLNLALVGRILGLGSRRLARVVVVPAAGLGAFAVAAMALRASGAGAVLGPAAAAVLFPLVACLAFGAAVLLLQPRILSEWRQVLAVVLGQERFE